VATIRDISLCGARITDVALPLGSLPIEPFSVALRPMQKPMEDVELQGTIVRILSNGATSFGIQFAPVSGPLEKKLRRIATG
ncbi:MAG TPA: PilZ domain-containing protein, partial [Planctomycetota bacterium]|nr:PilZ domain-containing protein [Planctomycetota bacterium]